MVNIDKIQTALVGLVGFRQPFNSKYAIIDAANLLSASGYFVNDNHYAKIELIKDNYDYKDISNADFNTFLRTMQKASISNVINQVFSDFDFIDNNVLYQNANNKVETETLTTGFIGEKIRVTGEKNICFAIDSILLDFEGTGNITFYLWNTAKKVFLKEQTVTITTDHQEVVLNWVLDNTDTTYKGDYYIGYINDGLTVTPYKRNYQNANLRTNFKNLCIEKVFVENHLDSDLFNLDLVEGLSEDTGMNLKLSVFEDFTDFVITNKRLFAKAISIDMVIQCLQMYLSSLRSNRNEMIAEDLYEKVRAELKGTNKDAFIPIIGMEQQLVGEIASIRTEIFKLKKGFFKTNQLTTSTIKA